MFAYTSNALVPVAVVVIVLILPVLLGQEKSGALLHTKDNRLFNHILHHNIFKLITINIGFPTDSTSRKISLLHENATPQIQADFFTLQPKPCVVKSGQKAGFNICFQFDGSSYQTQWQYKPQSSQPWIPLPSSSPTSTCLVYCLIDIYHNNMVFYAVFWYTKRNGGEFIWQERKSIMLSSPIRNIKS